MGSVPTYRSPGRRGPAPVPKNVRPGPIDDVDERILHELVADARLPNNALAERGRYRTLDAVSDGCEHCGTEA